MFSQWSTILVTVVENNLTSMLVKGGELKSKQSSYKTNIVSRNVSSRQGSHIQGTECFKQ